MSEGYNRQYRSYIVVFNSNARAREGGQMDGYDQ
jgi:hypothetical protein